MINVTKKDKENENKVLSVVKDMFEPFKYIRFEQNDDDDVALFDFDGYYGKAKMMSVEVKNLYDKSTKYDTNIISIDKWKHFIKNVRQRDFYVIYFYPKENLVRIYDLNECTNARVGQITVNHKREKVTRKYKVVFLPVSKLVMQGVLNGNK